MTNNISKTASFFKALGDPTRIKILKLLLSGKKLCVGMIAFKLNITQSAVSQQLKILKSNGIVEGTRTGFNMHYRVNEAVFKKFGVDLSKIIEGKI
jgi:DNA-binding transcriptional ArsR family regulator